MSKLNTKANRKKQYERGRYDAGHGRDLTFGHNNELGTEADALDRAYRKGWYNVRGGTPPDPKPPTFQTTGRSYELKYYSELTKKEQAELDYVKEDTNSFFRYKGYVYDAGEFARILRPEELANEHHPLCLRDYNGDFDDWDAYQSDSHFSGIVIRYKRDSEGEMDPERIIIGTYFV